MVKTLVKAVWQLLKKLSTEGPRDSTPKYTPKRTENVRSRRNLHMNFHSGVIKITSVSIDG